MELLYSYNPCVSFHYWKTLHYEIKVAIMHDHVIKYICYAFHFLISGWAFHLYASNPESTNRCLDPNMLIFN